MRLAKQTADGVFKIIIDSTVTEDVPITPEQIRHLARTLNELAAQVVLLAKSASQPTVPIH